MTLLSRFQWDRIPFHCRRPCPVKSESHLTGVNGNGKIIDLCALCALSEAGGEKYALTCPQSKAGTISIAEGLMD
jgi:hypothetical protein